MTVELTKQEWVDILNVLEHGIKSLGRQAFIPGGLLMKKIEEQISISELSTTNDNSDN
jgi:hypothetical protein